MKTLIAGLIVSAAALAGGSASALGKATETLRELAGEKAVMSAAPVSSVAGAPVAVMRGKAAPVAARKKCTMVLGPEEVDNLPVPRNLTDPNAGEQLMALWSRFSNIRRHVDHDGACCNEGLKLTAAVYKQRLISLQESQAGMGPRQIWGELRLAISAAGNVANAP